MSGVKNGRGESIITQHRGGFAERHAMFREVRDGLVVVPLKFGLSHAPSILGHGREDGQGSRLPLTSRGVFVQREQLPENSEGFTGLSGKASDPPSG